MHSTHSATRDFIVMAGPDGPRLPQMPALDGLRGIAVAAVVLYHGGFTVMVGGYLGVSTFFTLSGFLITSLLLNESARTGGVRIGAFWGRRFRRLLPASMVTLALVSTLFAWFVATADQRATMRGDVLASLFDVANWHFIVQGSSYGQLFVAPSPLLHFWSLAIEEQFYLLFPVVLLVLWRATNGRRGALGLSLAAGAALSAALPWIFTMSHDRIYFGTDTRAVELLVGAVLAVVLSNSGLRRRLAVDHRWRGALSIAGLIVLGVQAYWWWTAAQSSNWLYRGGFGLYALMSAVLIAATALPQSATSHLFANAPLRWLGLRSYGIYLAHWPIYLVVRQQLPDWGKIPQAVLAIGTSLVVAELSYRFVERPIRLGTWPSRRWSARVAGVSMASIVLIALIPLPIDESARATDFEAALDEFQTDPPVEAAPTTTQVPTAAPVPPKSVRVSTFGDSTALLTGLALRDRSADDDRLLEVGGDVQIGCGVSRFTRLRVDVERTPDDECRAWPTRWSAGVEWLKPDVVQLITGAWEVGNARLPGSTAWTSIGAPEADEFIRGELTLAVDTLSSAGAMVLLVLWPEYAPWTPDEGNPDVADQIDPVRMDRLHELMREVAASRPATVRVFDLAGWLGPERLADEDLRPDGLHISETDMQTLYGEGLTDAVYDVWREWWMAERAPAIVASAGEAVPGDGAAPADGAAPSDGAAPADHTVAPSGG